MEHIPLPGEEVSGEFDPRFNVPRHYGDDYQRFLLRANIYKHTLDGRDLYTECLDKIQVPNEGLMVDVGCGPSDFLYRAQQRQPDATYVGVDIKAEVLAQDARYAPVKYVKGSALHLPFPDHSVDVLSALSVLYHTAAPWQALLEIKRVLRPNGVAIISTSSPTNRYKSRDFEKAISKKVGNKPPPVFNDYFDELIAESWLPEHFDVAQEGSSDYIPPQRTQIAVTEENIAEYLQALGSVDEDYDPPWSELSPEQKIRWGWAIHMIVIPSILDDIALDGHFLDPAEKTFYFCRPKP